jgi:P-type E1-E2 ATPase
MIEPLRARAVILLEDGFRHLCSPECRDRFVQGERFRRGTEPVRASASSSGGGTGTDPALRAIRAKKKTRAPGGTSSSEWTAPGVPPSETAMSPPALPFAIVGTALCAGAFATSATVVGIGAVLLIAAATLAVVGPARPRHDAGWLAAATGPGAVVLATISALVAFGDRGDARLPLVGASFVAASVVLRGWLDATAARPLERIVTALRARMPARVRTPIDGTSNPLRVDARQVEAERLRAGEEVIVAEGETVPVDGVVSAGDAYVVPYPAARVPVRRRAGDPVIAGAQVTDGAIRVLATRVGEHRALLRPARFADGTADDAARITRLTARSVPFAGLAVVLLVGAGLWLGEAGGGLAARLGAAAGVLLAIPLLALRRAAESPFVAAGATAAERGIIFQSARALDRAGRVDVAALCTHGTITEGAPEVVEIHVAGEGSADDAIAAAAAAEAAQPEHPIARAILRYVEQRGLAVTAVRRALALPGRGVTAVGAGGESIVVGSRQLLLDEGISVAALDVEAQRAEQRGLSVVFVGIERRVRAVIALRDEDRPGARAAVQRLIDLDIEVLLLSGDHRGTVEALARTLEVDHVKAELGPDERGAEIRRLREGGRVVSTIGRAGHDEAALAAADVPVVLGAAGSSEGERAVALTGDDVRDAAAALWLASAARREATRAATIAAVGGATLVLLAAFGTIGPGAVAIGAMAIDAYALPAAARLLRRIELRLPARG